MRSDRPVFPQQVPGHGRQQAAAVIRRGRLGSPALPVLSFPFQRHMSLTLPKILPLMPPSSRATCDIKQISIFSSFNK